jgi:hypothetical protein
MIMLSELKTREKKTESRHVESKDDREGDMEEEGLSFSGSTVLPWWARTNSHGRRRRKVSLLLSPFF